MCEFDFTLTPEKYLENALYYQKKDINLYFMNLTQSANLGYKDAMILLNREYLEHKDKDQIFNDQLIIFYKKTANMLLDYSLNYLGYMYKKGKGVKQDNKKAKELYERAIEKGNVFAMNNLAYMYRYGEGVKQDHKKAKELYERAIKKGNASAMNNLAYMYRYEEGLEQDNKKAKELYERAIEKGNARAMNNLAYMYHLGTEAERDCNKAKKLYERAIEKGNAVAMSNLAYMYRYGEGLEQDSKKAKELYERAIEKGDTSAMSNLAHMYQFGTGIEQNYDKAMELYYKAKNYSSCVELLIKNIDNNKITTLQIEYLLKLDVNSLSNTLKLIQTLYKSKIDLLELHFKYQPGEKGFLEAKKDFIRKSIKEY